MKYKSDLKKRCYSFSLDVIEFIGKVDVSRIYNSLFDQLLRSSTSIGANVFEASASSSKKEFIRFYDIVLRSANETKYWLGSINDGLKINTKVAEKLIKEATELSNIIAKSIINLKVNR